MPGRIRTPDLLIRSQTLYPAELRAQVRQSYYSNISKLFQQSSVRNSTSDVIIAGAGLGGTCAALWLSESKNVALISGTASAASTVAAGLVNPLAGQRMSRFWNSDTAYGDLTDTLTHAGALETYNPCGILRPALDEDQASLFQTLSKENPNSITWIPASQIRKDYPYVTATFGGAITTGGILDTPRMLNILLTKLSQCSTIIRENLTGWKERDSDVTVSLDSGRLLKAKTLILALGAGYTLFPELANLNLHCTKGQVIHVCIPKNISMPLPVSGHGYAVPIENRLILGTTYEHAPRDDGPTKAGIKRILSLTEQMIPWVKSTKILKTSAGIRVGVPRTRLPMVGPLTKHVWMLTGLGSKGLLFGAHIGRNLETWLADSSRIPKGLRVQNSKNLNLENV